MAQQNQAILDIIKQHGGKPASEVGAKPSNVPLPKEIADILAEHGATTPKPEVEMGKDVSDMLDPGSVGIIANPIGSLQGRNNTGLVRSGVNLVGAIGEGAEKAMGIDPYNQVKSIVGSTDKLDTSNILGTAPEAAKSGLIGKTIEGMANMSTPRGAIDAIKGTWSGIVDSPGKMKKGWDEKNPDKFIEGYGGTVGVSVPTVAGILEGANSLRKGLARPKQLQFDPSLPTGEVKKASQAAQDFAKIHGGDSSYELKGKLEGEVYEGIKGDLKQSELEVFNRPAKSTVEHEAILKHTAQRVWDEYKKYLDQGSTIDGNDVVKRAVEGYDGAVKGNHPDEFNTFVKKLEEAFKDKKLTPEEAQARLTQLNAEANGYYAANNMSDMAAKAKTAGAQRYLSTADALRGILDEHLPEGASNVRERYGYVAEAMTGMPMPSEAGRPFLKAMFDESAKAMSTRPGFAAMRGGFRALRSGGTDKLVRRMYEQTPYEKNPTTKPTTELTHPVTGEKQVVERGPNAVNRAIPTPTPSHPMSPRAVLEGKAPLEIPPNPIENPDLSSSWQNPPRVAPQHMQSFTPVSEGSRPQAVMIHTGVPGELPNINQRHAPIPVENDPLGRPAPNIGLPTPLEVGSGAPKLPEANTVNPVARSQALPAIPTGLETGRPNMGAIMTPDLPQTELTNPLSQGMSKVTSGPTPQVKEFQGNNPKAIQTEIDPVGASGDVRYQSAKPQGGIPTGIAGTADRGYFNQFGQGLPSSGLPMQIPQQEMLKTLGRYIGSNPLIRSGIGK